jgi:hypothetical protein
MLRRTAASTPVGTLSAGQRQTKTKRHRHGHRHRQTHTDTGTHTHRRASRCACACACAFPEKKKWLNKSYPHKCVRLRCFVRACAHGIPESTRLDIVHEDHPTSFLLKACRMLTPLPPNMRSGSGRGRGRGSDAGGYPRDDKRQKDGGRDCDARTCLLFVACDPQP